MTKKISIGITAILVIIAIVFSSVATLFIVFTSYNNLLVDLPQRADQYLKLSEIDELIRTQYYGKVDDLSVDNALASGYINGLKDSYSYYVSAEDFDSFNNYLSGKAEGIGLNAYYDNTSEALMVSYIYPDSPASDAGINTTYSITAVNGKSVSADNYEELISSLCNSTDKDIEVSFSSLSGEFSEKTLEFRTGYELQSCKYSVSDGTGYIRISAIYESTYESFVKAMSYMTENKVSSVILDLRNSTGVNYEEAARIIDFLVPVGTEGTGAIFTAKNLSGNTVLQYSSDAVSSNLSFAVLVNSRTEGTAELIACDLKDFGKAILIGEKTAGYGTMQKLFELQDGGYVFLSIAEIHPYISKSFNNIGITPDVVIETSESFKNQIGSDNFEDDEQYNAALKYLTGK